MNFDITGINGLTMIDRDTKEEFDLGKIETMEIEQDEFCRLGTTELKRIGAWDD